jgi:nucleoside-diphosphate-sugar epimerase
VACRILIAGCGDVGNALGIRLLAHGYRVYGLRRNVAALAPGIEPVAADLAEPGTLAALPREIAVLAYTAAAGGFDDAAYERAYVSGMANVLAALDRSRLERVLFTSSTGVYAQDDGSWVDEGSATVPGRFSGRRLLEGEALVARTGVSAISVRFGGIYGPGRESLIEQVRRGAPCADSPPSWTNRIHRDDCAGVLAHLIGLAQPAPVYLGVDSEPATRCQVMDWLAERLGVARPPRAAAEPRVRGGNKRCSNRRLLESGYRFIYPSYREGYAAVLARG